MELKEQRGGAGRRKAIERHVVAMRSSRSFLLHRSFEGRGWMQKEAENRLFVLPRATGKQAACMSQPPLTQAVCPAA